MFIIKAYQTIEKFLLNVRDIFWDYPDSVFFSRKSAVRNARKFYLKSRPLSHAFTSIFAFLLIASFASADIGAVLQIDRNTLIEGVVIGQDDSGKLQKVLSINPLVITNVQLKRDLSELIYEPLLRVNQDGEVTKVLAENVADVGEGKAYRIKLKEGVRWHDGKEFTSDDVVATFNLLRNLEFGSQTSSVYSKAAAKIDVVKIDKYRVEFNLINQDSVIPNFFEVISFKILPAHLIKDLNTTNIVFPQPYINRHPVGTGPFKVGPLNLDKVELKRNDDYYESVAKLKSIIFKLYKDQDQAISDLKTGQIHSIIGINSDSIQQLSTIPNLNVNKSNIIFNQYWGLYFNLGDAANPVLKDVKIRQAIDSSINKRMVVEALVDSAIEADGPIPPVSFAYCKSTSVKAGDIATGIDKENCYVDRFAYNVQYANRLLDETGWVIGEGQKYRTKESKVLQFDLVYVQNFDREKVVGLISRDLESIGIKLNLIAKTIAEVNNDHLLPGHFDILLYGVSTFIDPDRYELFHSSQIGFPNLNIASYKSKDTTVSIVEAKKVTIPKVDVALEKGRGLLNLTNRKEQYEVFQSIVLKEVPVVFLYHPVYTYITNKRVHGVRLNNMTALEDRFESVTEWYIEI